MPIKRIYFRGTFLTLSLALSMLCVSVTVFAKETVVLVTFDYPPLMYEQGDERGQHGIGVEIVKRLFANSNHYTLEVIYVPTNRAIHMFDAREVDMFLGSRLDVRSPDEQVLTLNITSLKAKLFCLQSICDNITTMEDVTGLSDIATIPGSPINQVLVDQGNELVILQSLGQVFQFLVSDRGKFAAAIDFAGYNQLKSMSLSREQPITAAEVILMQIPYDLVIHRNNPKADRLFHYLNDQLKSLPIDQSAQQLLKNYLQSEGVFSQ